MFLSGRAARVVRRGCVAVVGGVGCRRAGGEGGRGGAVVGVSGMPGRPRGEGVGRPGRRRRSTTPRGGGVWERLRLSEGSTTPGRGVGCGSVLPATPTLPRRRPSRATPGGSPDAAGAVRGQAQSTAGSAGRRPGMGRWRSAGGGGGAGGAPRPLFPRSRHGAGESSGECPSACGRSAVGAEDAPLAAGAQPGGPMLMPSQWLGLKSKTVVPYSGHRSGSSSGSPGSWAGTFVVPAACRSWWSSRWRTSVMGVLLAGRWGRLPGL